MLTREEVLIALTQLIRMIGHPEIEANLEELFEMPFDRNSLDRLSRIESKLDTLLAKSEHTRCRFSGSSGKDVIEFITGIGPAARSDALTHLGECLQGAQHLTICDPYFLSLNKTQRKTQSPTQYADAIGAVLPKTIRNLEIFSGKGKRTPDVAAALNSLFKQREIRVKSYKTDDIHDRVWIKDSFNAYSVGTSFNGLGNKWSFILPLPLVDLRTFLTEISIRRIELPTSKSV